MMLLKYRRPGSSEGTHRLGVTTLLVVLLLLGISSVAHASSSLYWYGEGNSTCWQAGQPGGSSFACDSVGAGFLPSHMVEGGISADIFGVSASGDYCNYYRLGDQLTLQDSTNEGSTTGYTPPTPYSSYQQSDAYKNVCQAGGANWGQEVRRAAPENGCWTTCGMHHFVSFHSQGSNNRPWNSAFGGPTLVVSAEADPQLLSDSSEDAGAWGYVCPVLQDVTTGGILEYCLQEWRAKTNSSEWGQERVGSCAGAGGDSLDTIASFFYPGTLYATEREGSANTFVLGSAGWRHYTAGISTGNLQNAISADNSHCGRSLSSSPQNYALIGLEQGLEGWRNISEIGGSARNLQLSTEYTPLPPSATTGSATSVQPLQATFNGTANPNGSDTHYYFQYGTSTSYGSTTGEVDAGSGTSAVPASTATALSPGTTYHYRIVASNSAGTVYGGDQTVTTPGPVEAVTTAATSVQQTEGTINGTVNPRGYGATYYFQYGPTNSYGFSTVEAEAGAGGSPVAEKVTITSLEPGSELHYRIVANSGGVVSYGSDQVLTTLRAEYVFYRGSNGGLENGYWTGHEWQWGPIGSAEVMTGSPSAVVKSEGLTLGRGVIDVFYRGTKNGLQNWLWNGKWSFSALGEENIMAGNPSAIALPGGEMRVFFRDTKGGLYNWLWNGSKWSQSPLGEENVMAGEPSAVAYPEGHVRVFFRDTKGGLYNWLWDGSKWSQSPIGGENVMAGNPSAVALSEGHVDVFYRGTNGALQNWLFNGSWSFSQLGEANVMAGNPSAIALPENNMQVYYRDVKNGLYNWWWHGGKWIPGALGEENLMAGDPSAIVWPDGNRDVFFEAPKEVLYNWFYTTAWSAGPLSSEKAIAGEPTGVAW
jgi:hypothetical protein